MIDDMLPEPEPSGALVPPPRNPPAALAADAPLPFRSEPRDIAPKEGILRQVVQSALDTLDDVGDRIAHAVGLR